MDVKDEHQESKIMISGTGIESCRGQEDRDMIVLVILQQ